MRDTVRFLRRALTGEKVTETYDTFAVKGFRLEAAARSSPCPSSSPRCARGCSTWPDGRATAPSSTGSSADDVARVAPIVTAHGADKEIVARIFVAPSEDTDAVRDAARFAIAAYLNVPVYRAFHEWLGRSDVLADMWSAWSAGDRPAALAAIPDHVVDALVVHGSPEQCRAHIQRYVDNGVTTPALAVLPLAPDIDVRRSLADLAPR